jgi:hypothetical protein
MLIRDVVNHFVTVHQRIRGLKWWQRTRDDLVLTGGNLPMIHLKFDAAGLQSIRDLFKDDGSSAAGVNGRCGSPIVGADWFSSWKCGLQKDELDLEPNEE